ncbi:MAG: homocysteine S-methyltransferase family protein [Raoultibacter sp.]|jgi:5-methyltetrahydrofolate--homocysteine methyltransferase
MPDIELRFHRDMLVLSSPVDASLERQGVDLDMDREFINLIEPDAVRDIYRLEEVAGAQILVTNTQGITRARLAHSNMEDRDFEIATASLAILKSLKPQHIFAEIGPCELPLDISSAASLRQTKGQYERAAKVFGSEGYDAFFLNGMTHPVDMQCALMAVRALSDVPVVASMDADFHTSEETLIETLALMEEYGANVVGFSSSAPLAKIVQLASLCREKTELPLIVQLKIAKVDPRQQESTEENPYFHADTMIEAATQLRGAGVQFLRAVGAARPSYTASLVAASAGFDVIT